MVPPTEACVQPKTNTPKVGCTLSVNDALPGAPSTDRCCDTSWIYAAPASSPSANLNVLLIPFPYRIDASDFTATAHCVDRDNLFFGVRQGWLSKGWRRASADDIKQLLLALIDAAQREAETVHALVLPELALDGTQVDEVARLLAGAKPRLELFVTGVLDRFDNDRFQKQCLYRVPPRRRSRPILASTKAPPVATRSRPNQAVQLGFALDQSGYGGSRSTLAAEAARLRLLGRAPALLRSSVRILPVPIPVMPVITLSVRNLLVALLMDGPQWERRGRADTRPYLLTTQAHPC